ncbi:DUF481 domain-containing protein [Verrucomicrobiaceae bacterium N1E253]|uniref:DUF481 domain-containing protein n=1 Tax=Oceaniferula marina TaxID=2748318 RepID=A0A851GHC3_9BACT|nr:DUF481 domain-containing protein [Oceaniferula marina]NWK56599.1 DUF481 domain-containing protein [Oceaniferula marina]
MPTITRHLLLFSLLLPLTSSAHDEKSSPPADGQWHSNLDLGLTIAKGNTDSLMVAAGIQTQKKQGPNALFGSLSYSYGEEDENKTTDETLAKATWKHQYAGENFYGLRFDGRRDTFAKIDYRMSLTGSLGHYLLNSDTHLLSLEFGLGGTFEEKDSTEDNYAHALVAQHFEYLISQDTKFYQNFSWFPRLDDGQDYKIIFEAGLETDLTDTIALKVFLSDQYENAPAEDKEKNDIKLITGIAYKF